MTVPDIQPDGNTSCDNKHKVLKKIITAAGILMISSLIVLIAGLRCGLITLPKAAADIPSIAEYENITSDDITSPVSDNEYASVEAYIAEYAHRHGLTMADYPQSIVKMLAFNPETDDFVLNYPLRKDKKPEIDLSEYKDCTEVPLFIQWDERWGYQTYGSNVMGLTGCGPTCLSMVAVYLLNDLQMDPGWMADFSTENGYCVKGNGTAWALMDEGAGQLGLQASSIDPRDSELVISCLKQGQPVICIMDSGFFTSSGHFIVLTGYENGQITINDPNSRLRSASLWDYQDFQDQISAMWVYSK